MKEAISKNKDIFEKYYKEYIEECEGISFMAPSSSFGRGGLAGRYKEACKRMVFNIIKESRDSGDCNFCQMPVILEGINHSPDCPILLQRDN